MKIGIITSGFEMLSLFKFLHKYDIEYHIYWDWNNWPYGDKDFEYSKKLIEKGIKYLKKQGVDNILVPPIYELEFANDKMIMPLFEEYLRDYCLKYSLIGKIGFVGDYSDEKNLKSKFKDIVKDYKLTENQKKIKKFNKKFPIWFKETTLWKYYLIKLGFRDWMIRKTIKEDVRYFKDAAVDTLVPLNWGYLFFDKIIDTKIKKIRFYGTDVVEEIFLSLVDKKKFDQYSINFHCNGTMKFLEREKKWRWLLARGKKVEFEAVNIK